jgi:hypothetical protein
MIHIYFHTIRFNHLYFYMILTFNITTNISSVTLWVSNLCFEGLNTSKLSHVRYFHEKVYTVQQANCAVHDIFMRKFTLSNKQIVPSTIFSWANLHCPTSKLSRARYFHEKVHTVQQVNCPAHDVSMRKFTLSNKQIVPSTIFSWECLHTVQQNIS